MRTDVLIIGGGLAGLNAAAELREKFPLLQCLVVDAGGGASSEIMGFCAPVAEADSPQVFYDDILRAGDGLNDPALARLLADNAVPEMKRLEAMGIAFDREPDGRYAVIHSIGSTCGRVVHAGTTTGRQAMELLAHPVEKCRIAHLLKSPAGAVCGAVTDAGDVIRAKAVILAGGGFAGLWKFSTWSKNLKGDMLIMARAVGAELCNLHCVQFEPTVTVHPEAAYAFPVITTLLHEGARLYDAAGNDLAAGGVPPKRELAVRIQRAIDAGHAFPHGGVCYDLSGVDGETLRRKYPEYCRKYLRWFPTLQDVRFEVRGAAHTTLGGIRIAPDTSTGVPGLFAAGEAVGNLHGRDRLGGNAGLEVFVFGRIAGCAAGKYAAGQPDFAPLPPLPEAEPALDTDILDRCFTVLPDRAKLEAGLEEMRTWPATGKTRFLQAVLQSRLAEMV